jgi:hypothetical protein
MTKNTIRRLAVGAWIFFGLFLVAATIFAREIPSMIALPTIEIGTAEFMFKLYMGISAALTAFVLVLQIFTLKSKKSQVRLKQMSVLRYASTIGPILAVSCLLVIVPWAYGVTFGLMDHLSFAYPFFIFVVLMFVLAWPSRIKISSNTTF